MRGAFLLWCSCSVSYALQKWGVPAFEETTRDTHSFGRRVGDLPQQLPGEEYDFRNLLHRDGSVFSSVDLKELKQVVCSMGRECHFAVRVSRN